MSIQTREQVAAGALKYPHKLAPTDLQVGDCVVFTNDYGVAFPGLHVVGFANPEDNGGRSVYLDFDCYWFPVAVHAIAKMIEG